MSPLAWDVEELSKLGSVISSIVVAVVHLGGGGAYQKKRPSRHGIREARRPLEAEQRGGRTSTRRGSGGAHAVRSPTELRGIRQAALRPVCTKQQRSGWWGRVGRTHDHDEGQRDEHHTTDVRRRWRGKTLRKGGVGLMPDERKSKRKPKEKDCNRKVPLLQLSTYMRKGGQRGGCVKPMDAPHQASCRL